MAKSSFRTHTPGKVCSRVCKHPAPSTLRIGKVPPKFFPGGDGGGVSRGHVLTSTYTFFSAMTCVHRRVLHALLAGKIAQMYPERRRLATSLRAPEKPPQGDTQERAPSGRTQNQPDRSPAQDPRGSAGDSVNGVRLGPPGGGPGGVRLLWGGVPAEISAARLSGLVVMVSPGTSDCCGRRRPRARCAEGPAASVCQLDAQVSAQAAL